MSRIAIMGSPGSGKSTFAKTLAQSTNLPLIHLDQEYFLPGWQPSSPEVWRDRHAQLISGDSWIIDGCYGSTAGARIARADLIVWFDVPTMLCLYRVLKRIATSFGEVRPDAAPGCPERLDWEFLVYVANFRRSQLAEHMARFEKRPEKTRLEIVRSNHDLVHVIDRVIGARDAQKLKKSNQCRK